MRGKRSRIPLGTLLVLALAPSPAAAQVASAGTCPAPGLEISADSLLAGPLGKAVGSAPVDTTYRIAVEQRRWSERDVSASVAAGLGGTDDARWRACAGAWVEMRRVEMMIEDAYGTVRIRSSLEPLLQRLRVRQPRPEENQPPEGS